MTGSGLSIDRNGRVVSSTDGKTTQASPLSAEWANAIQQAAKAKGVSVDDLDKDYYFVAVQPGGSIYGIGEESGLKDPVIAAQVLPANEHLVRPGHGQDLIYGDLDPAGQQDVVLLPKSAFAEDKPATPPAPPPPQEFGATLSGMPEKDRAPAVRQYISSVPADQREAALTTLIGLDYGQGNDTIRRSIFEGYVDLESEWGTSNDDNKPQTVKEIVDPLLRHSWGDDKTDVTIDTILAKLAKEKYGVDVDKTAWNGKEGRDPDGTP